MHRFTVTLTNEQYEYILERAHEKGTSISDIIKDLIWRDRAACDAAQGERWIDVVRPDGVHLRIPL